MNTTSPNHTAGSCNDESYHNYLARISARFSTNTDDGRLPLFTTDADDLWSIYLQSFDDPVERQVHNCHCCRHFIERFGGLAVINEDGSLVSAVWNEDDAPDSYKAAVRAMATAVRRAKVTGVFLSSDKVWGTPRTGAWQHLSVVPPASCVFRKRTQTAGQARAEKKEDFLNVMRALGEFLPAHLDLALTLLRSDSLYRSEKVIGPAEWLRSLHTARENVKGSARWSNLVWRAVATAPAGFCHPRSSMIGTLLEDIAAGKDFDEVSRAFKAKMHPLSYRRPKAAPAIATIEQAEKVVKQMGLALSLERRFCRLDEVTALWRTRPPTPEAPADGVFGHLRKSKSDPIIMDLPAQVITWDKFQRTVLPTADRIEVQAPASGPYSAFVTAVHPDAPPILQWDREDARNPVSWYFWANGSSASQFGLAARCFYDVPAVTLKPSMWNGGNEHQGKGVMFIIDKARESRVCGAALFPEILKSELHGVRSVLEAHSRESTISGMHEPHVAGIMLCPDQKKDWGVTVRVWTGGRGLDYCLDRWD